MSGAHGGTYTGRETRFVASLPTHVDEIAELGGDCVNRRRTICGERGARLYGGTTAAEERGGQPSRAASNSRSTRRSMIPGRSCSTSGTRARTPSRPTGGRRTSRRSSSSRSCRSWTSVLGHVWNHCPPNFAGARSEKADADVRPSVTDGEAYRGKAGSRCGSQTSRRGLLRGWVNGLLSRLFHPLDALT